MLGCFPLEPEAGLKVLQSERDFQASSLCTAPPSASELDEVLKVAAKRLHKSPGKDGVTNWMLVWGGKPTREALLNLYTRVWKEDTLPRQWSEAEISYLYKGDNKSKLDVTSYRPISLIPIIAKRDGVPIPPSFLTRVPTTHLARGVGYPPYNFP